MYIYKYIGIITLLSELTAVVISCMCFKQVTDSSESTFAQRFISSWSIVRKLYSRSDYASLGVWYVCMYV